MMPVKQALNSKWTKLKLKSVKTRAYIQLYMGILLNSKLNGYSWLSQREILICTPVSSNFTHLTPLFPPQMATIN